MDGHLFEVEALVFSFLFVLNFYFEFTSCGFVFIMFVGKLILGTRILVMLVCVCADKLI